MKQKHQCILGMNVGWDDCSDEVTDPCDLYDREDVYNFCNECGKKIEIDWDEVELEKKRRVEEARRASLKRRDRTTESISNFAELLDRRFDRLFTETYMEIPSFEKMFK